MLNISTNPYEMSASQKMRAVPARHPAHRFSPCIWNFSRFIV